MTPDITPEWCRRMAALEAAHGDPSIGAGRLALLTDPVALAADPAAVRSGATRFDGWEMKKELNPRERPFHLFVAAALDLAAARYGADCSSTEVQERPYLAAVRKAESALDALFDEHIAGTLIPDDEPPGVPELLGDFCRVCGCFDEDSCVPQCGWAGPGICTNCDAGGVRPAPGVATPEQSRRCRELAEEEWLSRQRSVDGMERVLATRECQGAAS